jgi:hypothetical protein
MLGKELTRETYQAQSLSLILAWLAGKIHVPKTAKRTANSSLDEITGRNWRAALNSDDSRVINTKR